MKKKIFVFALASMILCSGVFSHTASADSSNSSKLSEETLKRVEAFPGLREHMEETVAGPAISTTDVYYKYTAKYNEDDIVSQSSLMTSELETDAVNYTVEECSKEEYDAEKLATELEGTTRLTRIGEMKAKSVLIKSDDDHNSWMHLTLEIYQLPGSDVRYDVYSFADWIHKPFFHGTDSLGISCTEGYEIMANDNYRSNMYVSYCEGQMDGSSPGRPYSYSGRCEQEPKGIRFDFALFGYDFHEVYLETGIVKINPNIKGGHIFTKYLHTEIGCTGIGFDSSFLPSVNFGITNDSFSFNTDVGDMD